jgi:hypothetical protein
MSRLRVDAMGAKTKQAESAKNDSAEVLKIVWQTAEATVSRAILHPSLGSPAAPLPYQAYQSGEECKPCEGYGEFPLNSPVVKTTRCERFDLF